MVDAAKSVEKDGQDIVQRFSESSIHDLDF